MKQGLINKLLLVSSLLLFTLCTIPSFAAVNPNKNSSVYYEIDFTYPNIINRRSYTEEADLLRNKAWLSNNHLHKDGDTMVLSIPEFGVVRVKATVVKLVKTAFNPAITNNNGSNMITGKFMHFSNDVRAYKLKELKTGYLQTIKATPNHSFYVKNRIAYNQYLHKYSHFIEIQHITPLDTLINESGDEVKLVCNPINNTPNNNPSKITYRHKPCGNPIDTNNQNPIPVYNLEIYSKHQYLVTDNKNNFKPKEVVLVHNLGCLQRIREWWNGIERTNDITMNNQNDEAWYLGLLAPLAEEYASYDRKANLLSIKDKESYYNSRYKQCGFNAMCFLESSYDINPSESAKKWFAGFNTNADPSKYQSIEAVSRLMREKGVVITKIETFINPTAFSSTAFRSLVKRVNKMDRFMVYMKGHNIEGPHAVGVYQESGLFYDSDYIATNTLRINPFKYNKSMYFGYKEYHLYKVDIIPIPDIDNIYF